jgi:FkbM family methyltransferase
MPEGLIDNSAFIIHHLMLSQGEKRLLTTMNFSGISKQTPLGKLLRFPLKFIPPQTVIPIWQGKLRKKKWIVGSGDSGYWLGSYEYEKQLLFEQTIPEGSVVFDIGAHVGFYTLLSSVIVGTSGKVVAFEPLPRNLFYLHEHLRLNHIQNVMVIEAAVSAASRVTSFDESPTSFTGHISPQGTLQVKTVALDELTSTGQIPMPTHIKLDVEGAELSVLSGARETLSLAHPTIFLATHGDEIHQQACQFLESLGYHLKAIGAESIQQSSEIIAYP